MYYPNSRILYDSMKLVCGHQYALGLNSPWIPFFMKHTRHCYTYDYLVCGDNDQYPIIPAYNFDVKELNAGMKKWGYSEWTVLKPETQEARYEWFLTEELPRFDINKDGVEVDKKGNLRIESEVKFKHAYYTCMTRRLGRCARAHGGPHKCTPWKGFLIYMAKRGHKVYESVPFQLIDLMKHVGVNNQENIQRLRAELRDYAQTVNKTDYDPQYFMLLDELP